MRKILMVSSFYPPYHVGGACTHVYYLANELARRGHEIHVLYSRDAYVLKRSGKPETGRFVNHKNVHLHPINCAIGKWGPVLSFVSGMVTEEDRILQIMSQDYDVIHYHNISLLGARILQCGSAPKIYTAHDHWLVCANNDFFDKGKRCEKRPSPTTCSACLIRNKKPPQLWRFGKMLKAGLEELEYIITPSHYIRQFLVEHGIQKKMILMPNFVPHPPKVSTNGSGYFFYAGMLERNKGVHTLLEAFSRNNEQLVIAGEGSLKSTVQQIADDRIRYVGYVAKNKIYSLYKGARAFILPSAGPENSPLTVLEAMSVGTPTIGSDKGGILEMVGSDFVFDGSADGLNKAISRLRKPRDLEKKYQRQYAPEAYVKRYLDLLGRIKT